MLCINDKTLTASTKQKKFYTAVPEKNKSQLLKQMYGLTLYYIRECYWNQFYFIRFNIM